MAGASAYASGVASVTGEGDKDPVAEEQRASGPLTEDPEIFARRIDLRSKITGILLRVKRLSKVYDEKTELLQKLNDYKNRLSTGRNVGPEILDLIVSELNGEVTPELLALEADMELHGYPPDLPAGVQGNNGHALAKKDEVAIPRIIGSTNFGKMTDREWKEFIQSTPAETIRAAASGSKGSDGENGNSKLLERLMDTQQKFFEERFAQLRSQANWNPFEMFDTLRQHNIPVVIGGVGAGATDPATAKVQGTHELVKTVVQGHNQTKNQLLTILGPLARDEIKQRRRQHYGSAPVVHQYSADEAASLAEEQSTADAREREEEENEEHDEQVTFHGHNGHDGDGGPDTGPDNGSDRSQPRNGNGNGGARRGR